jgi:hypothetical protein
MFLMERQFPLTFTRLRENSAFINTISFREEREWAWCKSTVRVSHVLFKFRWLISLFAQSRLSLRQLPLILFCILWSPPDDRTIQNDINSGSRFEWIIHCFSKIRFSIPWSLSKKCFNLIIYWIKTIVICLFLLKKCDSWWLMGQWPDNRTIKFNSSQNQTFYSFLISFCENKGFLMISAMMMNFDEISQ